MIGGGRIQLNGWQQAAVAVGSAVGALLDPRRADLIYSGAWRNNRKTCF
ncbi:hypothetical protein NC651_024914 [Populus alba x Populus x berolinensis]|nr:hypothetical protein NC651_024914 [Populus alba x Populus x berolinensis]